MPFNLKKYLDDYVVVYLNDVWTYQKRNEDYKKYINWY